MRKLFLTILSFTFLCSCSRATASTSKTKIILDTVCTITLYDTSSDTIIDNCFDLCEQESLIFSMQDKKSELYKINHSKNKLTGITISNDLYNVIKVGLDYSKQTHGAFDITIGSVSTLWDFESNTPALPNQNVLDKALKSVSYKNIILSKNKVAYTDEETMIDVGSIAKGYIADQIKDYLIKKKVSSAIINLGGNILCVGKNNKDDFKIGIENPKDTNKNIQTLYIDDLTVVTSGTYQRCFKINNQNYHHILNPKTGYPLNNGLSSVTIISEDSFMGDILSTVCFVLGKKKGLELINHTKNTEACFIDNDNRLYYSNHFNDYTK